jgi:mannose-1-phosphate guanylyltransferase
MVIQPANRGTAVAMALCLEIIAQYDEDALVTFFPSDHHYTNCSAFRENIDYGLCLMPEYPQSVLVVGAKARYPEVEYGWIEPGRTLVDSVSRPLLRVARFSEKPELQRAEELLQQGALWNTFVTIGMAGAFRELLYATVPQLLRSLESFSRNFELDRFYENVAPVDFAKAVLAKMPGRLVVLEDGASGWTDLGSPRRVTDVLLREGIRPSWLKSDRRYSGGRVVNGR